MVLYSVTRRWIYKHCDSFRLWIDDFTFAIIGINFQIMRRMLIAGANGFIARHLCEYFLQHDWEVIGLARQSEGVPSGCRYVHWDGESLGDWVSELGKCEVLINLVGRSINCRHTEENKRQILSSRVNSTKLLGKAIHACDDPPELWINGSAAGIYEATREQAHGETGKQGSGFIAEVVKEWEEAFFSAEIPSAVRRVALRTTMVFADEPGNPYRILHSLAKWGLGGRVGNGKQMVSWIHIEDVVRAIAFIISYNDVFGPINLSAPGAMSNSEMMRRFRKSAGMPIGIPAPALGVRVGAYLMGTAPELVLDSSWVDPAALRDAGFEFDHPELIPGEWSG